MQTLNGFKFKMIDLSFNNDLALVLTTEADSSIADNLAKELLNRRLAICVSLREVKSHFWWEGKLEQVNEVQLLIKTTKDQLQNLLEDINQLHSYQIPELLYWNASASDEYRKWAEDSIIPRSIHES